MSLRAECLGLGLVLAAALAVSGIPVTDFTLTKGASGSKLAFLVFDTSTLDSNLLSRSKKQAPSEIRTSPIYATAGNGTPVTALRADDLEVKLGGRLISNFTLTKGESPNKLVFLVFDAASLDSNLLGRSKKIAQSMIDRAAGGVRFVVMSIDPGLGLSTVCGPTGDKRIVLKSIDESVTSKSIVYLRNRATTGRGTDFMEDRLSGTVIITSLRTLNALFAKFPESNKVVHFYSGGIPQGPMLDRSPIKRYTYVGEATTPVYYEDLDNFTSRSTEAYEQIRGIGRAINKSGAVLFALFAIDTRGVGRPLAVVDAGGGVGLKRETDESSGEPSLRLLANESGGRFFKGTDEDIIGSLSAVEQGYYELAIGVPESKRGAGVPLEVRAKDGRLRLSSVGFLAAPRATVPGR